MSRTLDRRESGGCKSQPATCSHNQTHLLVLPQHARGRVAQVVLELLQEPERPADVPCWRVCEMTRHRAGNLGQIALSDKTLSVSGSTELHRFEWNGPWLPPLPPPAR